MPSAFKKPKRAGRPDGVQKGDRVRAAFVRYFDASPQKLDELAAAAVEKAIAGERGPLHSFGTLWTEGRFSAATSTSRSSIGRPRS
jgi:hypothetical protein